VWQWPDDTGGGSGGGADGTGGGSGGGADGTGSASSGSGDGGAALLNPAIAAHTTVTRIAWCLGMAHAVALAVALAVDTATRSVRGLLVSRAIVLGGSALAVAAAVLPAAPDYASLVPLRGAFIFFFFFFF
jgi:hypothetical protein